nr:hypothetical protein [Tanacetum cinerariifolium]
MNATLEAEVLTRSSHSSKTSYAIAADLSEIKLKKILIEKMEGIKSIQRSNEQRNLYKALVEAYDADKTILDTYGESTILKRRREDDDQEGPSAGLDRGSKRREKEVSMHQLALHLKQQLGVQEELPQAAQEDAQSWISDLARQTDARSSFNELLDTPIDFSNFIMNRLGVATLSPELLAGPTYELIRGSCNSLTELEFHLEEVYKETTDQLDWVNPEGQQYPHNLLQPLPLIPDNRGRRVIPFEHFINNNLEYLRGGASSRKYTTSVTKTKAADYGHIKWIEDLVPREMWIQQPIDYNKHALWGVSHWGRNVNSSMDRGSKRHIEGKEPESASVPLKTATRSAGRSTTGVDTLTPELLVGPTYDLMKGSCKSLIELTVSTQSATASTVDTRQPRSSYYDKHALWGVSHWGRKRQQLYGFAVNRESARDVYSKRRIIAVTELKIVEWYSYKHLDWITVRRDDDKLYKFKEGDYKRLRIQDIEDMLLFLLQGKLTNL